MSTDFQRDPIGFIDAFILKDEKGRPFRLSPHQRRVLARAFQWDEDGRLRFRILLWGEVKKSGKSFLAASLVLWWAFVTPHTEVKIAANDYDQTGRVFKTVTQLLAQNPVLGGSARILAGEVQLTNGTVIEAIPSDYKGEAGGRQSLSVVDEPWGIMQERAERLFEELSPVPTEENAWLLLVTHAGWTGESVVLERLYKRGLSGARIDEELELYRQDDLVMFWSHTPRQPWQTDAYYASQRELLRPTTFARLHQNTWTTNESAFITPELWDACVGTPAPPSTCEEECGGIDLGFKRDTMAAVRVRWVEERLHLVAFTIWRPTPQVPLQLATTIEPYLRAHVRAVGRWLIDPWQGYEFINRLRPDVPIEEYPQTVANTTRMAQVLYDLLRTKRLVLPSDEELRQQALNCVAIETPNGHRIAKEKQSKKIDAIVALAMACVAAEREHRRPSLEFYVSGEGRPERDYQAEMVDVGGQKLDPDLATLFSKDPRAMSRYWRPI